MALEPNNGWQMEIDIDARGHWRQVRWRLPAASIQYALFGPPETGASRAGERPVEQSALLLSDVTVLDDQLVATTLIVHAEGATGQVRLNALITAEQDWPPGVQAHLQIGNRTLTTAITGGAADYPGLSLDELLLGISLSIERHPTDD